MTSSNDGPRLFELPEVSDPTPDVADAMLSAGYHPATGLPLLDERSPHRLDATHPTCGTCAHIHYQPRAQPPLCVMARFYGGSSYTFHYWPACSAYRLYDGKPSRKRKRRAVKSTRVSAPTIEGWLLGGDLDDRLVLDVRTDEKFL